MGKAGILTSLGLATVTMLGIGQADLAWTQLAPARTASPASPFFDEAEVRLVLLHATVLNRRGESVRGLDAGDFVLRDEGVPREISVFGSADDQPLKVAFLLDVSGSMALGGKLAVARDAITRFVAALREGDQVALLIFADGGVVVRCGFTGDRSRFLDSLASITAWGRTALHSAVAATPALLAEAAPGRKALVLISDGLDNASPIAAGEAIDLARRVAVPFYAISLADLPDEYRATPTAAGAGTHFTNVLKEVARASGGDLLPAFGADAILAAAHTIESRLRAQYVIGFHPPSPKTPGFRRLELAVRGRRYEIQTRGGYLVQP